MVRVFPNTISTTYVTDRLTILRTGMWSMEVRPIVSCLRPVQYYPSCNGHRPMQDFYLSKHTPCHGHDSKLLQLHRLAMQQASHCLFGCHFSWMSQVKVVCRYATGMVPIFLLVTATGFNFSTVEELRDESVL